MERTVEIRFSEQAESILDATEASRSDVVDFLVEKRGFTVGGNEVVSFLEAEQG